MPKVSVILTSFNHAKYIREAIDSVLTQSFNDFELIIWDDASIDNSWKIIESYDDPRIKAFRNVKTMRGAYGINKAITEIACGDYIAIQHSDDDWRQDKLGKQVEYLDANHHCAAVFTGIKLVDEYGREFLDENHVFHSLFDHENRSRHEWLRMFFFKGNGLCHPSVLIRKSCYEGVGVYDRRLGSIPDLDLWIRICLRYDIHIIQEKLVNFRVLPRAENASGNRPDNFIRYNTECIFVLQRYRAIETLSEFKRIFSQESYDGNESEAIIDYLLARIAINTGQSSHCAFGISLLYELMSDQRKVDILEKVYDFTYKDLVQLAGTLDIFHSIDIDAYQKIKHIKSTWSWQITKPLRLCAFLYRRLFNEKL